MPTTSHRPRRSSGSAGSIPQSSSPIKSIRLKVTVVGAGGKELASLAAGEGLAVEEEGGTVSVVISAATPEDALSRLKLLSAALARKT